jgi:putative addiction module component (TIGR02574 family)
MARNFRELEAKMSPESRARSRALADQYRAAAEVPLPVSEILEKALALTSHERGLLIDLLIYTLDIEPNGPAEEGVEAAWKKEIERRIEDVRSGRVKTIPGEQVLARARARLRDATAADAARRFEKLDESGPEPFGGEKKLPPTPKK